MAEARFSEIDTQFTSGLDIQKIAKLDKLLSKVDHDFKAKQQKDITKTKLMEMMRTMHEIYQIVLYEISEMLEAAHLSELRQTLNKIYNGQNLIVHYILKVNTNFEVQPAEMLENLQKNIVQQRRKSVDPQEERENSKLASQIVQLQPVVKKMMKKVYAEKSTDTGEDMKNARDQNQLKKKEQELTDLQDDFDEEGQKITEFLKNRRIDLQAVGESKASANLKEVLKDLGKKKRITNELEDEAAEIEERQNKEKEQIYSLENTLMEGIRGLQKQAQDKALQDIKAGKALMKNGHLVYMESHEQMTDKMKIEIEFEEKMAYFRKEGSDREGKILQLERKVKDVIIERDAYIQQLNNINTQIVKLNIENKKLQEQQKQKEKVVNDQQAIINKSDSEKIKKLVEDNIKMKFRIKNLIDNVAILEKEYNRSLERFRQFIQNSQLTDDQKRTILSQMENLFRFNFSEKLNLQEMKELMVIDDLLKDPLFKQICGTDISAITRQVKKDEMTRKQKMAKVPFYDPLFDPEFLNPGEKIITRKVMKMVKRQNSKGEWIEEEIEVEEEVVVNAQGEELRTRDKPITIQQSKETQQFLEQYGGFAIGGAKINIPQQIKSKDGKQILMNEWFEDSQGKKVRKIQGINGEETYEMEEEYIDENGQKQKRIKIMKIKKDRNGNQIIEEEFNDAQGRKNKVQKRVIKDKDGNDIIEEVIVDEFGNKNIKKQKVYKDKDGNEIIEEEIIDKFGNKTTIKRKVVKDSNGKQIIIEERTDAQGNKIIATIKKNEFGQDVIQEQVIDKNGKIKQIEKKIYIDQNGNAITEEIIMDEKGNKIIKRTKLKKDENGNDIVEEETINADGSITIKVSKNIKNADGTITIESEIIDENGNTIKIRQRQFKDKNGNIITEEEVIDPITGQKTITRTIKDQYGKETIQQQIIGADGKVKNIQKNQQLDKDGNIIEIETLVDENGKTITKQQKIYKDKNGNEIKEQIITDDQGNKKLIKTRAYKDKDGNQIIEEVTTNEDGSKITVKKKQYKDKEGFEITEIETIDANGNKVVIRTKKGQNGEEIIEETKIGKDGKIEKSIKKFTKDKNGNVIIEETKINSDGKTTVNISKLGISDKFVQTEGNLDFDEKSQSLLEQIIFALENLGLEKSKIEQIRNWILRKQQIQLKKNATQQQIKTQTHQTQQQDSEDEQFRKRPKSSKSDSSLESLDDEEQSEEDQSEKLYNKLIKNKGGAMAELLRQIRNQLGKQGNEPISLEEFKEYMNKMRQVHSKCGENCPHLRRFYQKIGFVTKRYKRRFLKMHLTNLDAKTKLPQLQNFSTIKG